jgi:hypothetical protein
MIEFPDKRAWLKNQSVYCDGEWIGWLGVCVEVMMMAVRLGFIGKRRLQDHSRQPYCDTSQDVHGACGILWKYIIEFSLKFRAQIRE